MPFIFGLFFAVYLFFQALLPPFWLQSVIRTPFTSSLISNATRISFLTSLVLRSISITFLISIVAKLLFKPLLIPNCNLKKKLWNSCNSFSPSKIGQVVYFDVHKVIKFEVHVCCYLCPFRDLFWNTCLDVFVHEVSNSQSHNYCLNIALDPYSKQKKIA